MTMFYEKAMVPEHSSFSGDKSAKWITLFIGTEYSFKLEKLLEVLQDIAGRACTVERLPDDPRYDSNIYKFFYGVRNATYQGTTVAERLRAKLDVMEERAKEMERLHEPLDWMEGKE